MDPVITAFALVYAGMILGRIPGLAVDRTGIALLGVILLLATGRLGVDEAWRAVDVPTIALLFALMVVSAQLRLGGFYTAVTRRIAAGADRPERLLLVVVATSGALSAVLANDIVCLAMAPVLIDACARRRLDPVPFLLALAAAANVGSAATLIGNPQNMLIGQALGLSFRGYLLDAALPAVAGLLVVHGVLLASYRGRWHREVAVAVPRDRPLDRWQALKGCAVLSGLIVVFVAGDGRREIAALAAASVLLLSRKLHSREMLGLVDWQLCVLFIGLFAVNHALAASGATQRALDWALGHGVDLAHPAWLFLATVVGSNVVSNVPAVMLLLPAATHPQAGAVLALASTLAGNLFLVGSIANLIVVDQAERLGVAPAGRSWFVEHLRVGVPISLLTLAIAAAWLAL